MNFGMNTSRTRHMAASASMFYIASDCKNEPNKKVEGSSVNIKIHQRFSKSNLDLFK